ncbi:MAG: hypothetical protein JXA41_11620 [Deltaproteobacteria bacterium]|nr:hypothetical protein [Deltaproteobacteria bacterium]
MKKLPIIKNLFLLVGLLLCCNEAQAGEIKPIRGPDADTYALINGVTILQLEKRNVTIKVFETGGGDPAVNGNRLIIHISEWDPAGKRYTWNSDIDIYEVEQIELKGDQIIIKCTEHVSETDSGTINTVQGRYFLSYFFDKQGHIKDTITVEKTKH